MLFGSSRSLADNGRGDEIYLWKVTLDGNHDPDGTTLACFKVKTGDIIGRGHILGLMPKTANKKLQAVWWGEDKKVYYFFFEWKVSKVQTYQIHE